MQEVEDNKDINAIDISTPAPPPGPITRAPITRVCARQLNHQLSSLLSYCP